MTFDITIVVSDPCRDPDLPEAVFEGFLAAGCDPVVSRESDAQETTICIDVAAEDAASASQGAIAILRGIATSQRLIPTAIHVAAVAQRAAPRAA